MTIPKFHALIAILGVTSLASQAAIIYSETFSGSGSASLNGQAPTSAFSLDGGSASSIWSSHSGMLNNGFPVNADDSSALLPFNPVADRIYTLTVVLTTAASATEDNDWLGFGFNAAATVINPGTIVATNSGRFTDSGQLGKVWSIVRENTAGGAGDVEFFSSGTLGAITTTDTDASFDGFVQHTMALELATWGGNLTANLFVDGSSITGGFQPVTGVALADINGVGITHNNTTQTGVNFESLSLAVIPEPSAAILGALGMLPLFRRRRD